MKYEKLNLKYKEINSNLNNNTRSEKAREFPVKENQNLQNQIEKLIKEVVNEKEWYFKT